MAIDQKNIALDSCLAIVKNVNNLLKAMDELEVIQEQLSAAGIDLTTYTTEIEMHTGLKHCEAITLKNIINDFAPRIVVDMKAYYSGTPAQQSWVAFQKARTSQI